MDHQTNRLRIFRNVVTSVIVAGLSIHLALMLFLTFSASLEPLGKSLPAGIYQHLFHLGPFYRESSIQSSDHFVVGLLRDKNWNYVDVSLKHFDRYLNEPWLSHEITIRDYIRDQCVNLERAKDPRQSPSFHKMVRLTRDELPEYNTSDSVRWLVIRRWYNIDSHNHRADTVFHLTFSSGDAER